MNIKKVFIFAVIGAFGAMVLSTYTQPITEPITEDNKSKSTQVLTKAGQLITVTFAGHCGDLVQTAITETLNDEYGSFDQTDLNTISTEIKEYAGEKGCTVSELNLTLTGVQM